MTQNELKAQELAQQRQIADKDRQSREAVEDRKRATETRGQDVAADATKYSARARAFGKIGLLPAPYSVKDRLSTARSVLGGGENDTSWYNKNRQLLKDVASISFEDALGELTTLFHSVENGEAIAGHMTIGFVPSIGLANGDGTVVNQAAQKLYSFVRHANSGSRNYEARDMMEYILCMDSAYTYIAWLCKLYSLALTYKTHDRYFARAILKSEGVDVNNLTANLANFREGINTALIELGSYAIPKDWDYFSRHIWLTQGIFKDHEIKKSSTYSFRPEGYYYLDNTDGSMIFENILWPTQDSQLQTVENLLAVWRTIRDKIIGIEDIGIMSGDIIKAFGSSGLFSVEPINETFHIETIFSDEVLSQINAMDLVGIPVPNNIKIIQSSQGQFLEYADSNPFFTINTVNISNINPESNATFQNQSNISDLQTAIGINMYKDDPTQDDIMVASRGMAHYTSALASSATLISVQNTVDAVGTEFFTRASIVQFVDDGEGNKTLQLVSNLTGTRFVITSSSTMVSQFTSNTATRMILQNYATFDWAPKMRIMIIPITKGTQTGTPFVIGDVVCLYDSVDYCNYTNVSVKNLRSMHNVALMSELNVYNLLTDGSIKKYNG